MPVPKKYSIIGDAKNNLETRKVEILDIKFIDKIVEKNGYEFSYPFEFSFQSKRKGGSTMKFVEESTRSKYARDWNKKFYVKTTTKDGIDYHSVNFTRNEILMALIQILDIDASGDFDINTLIEKEFEAKFVFVDGKVEFLDWYETFKHNNVEVPEVKDLRPDLFEPEVKVTGDDLDKAINEQSQLIKDTAKTKKASSKNADQLINTDDIPF